MRKLKYVKLFEEMTSNELGFDDLSNLSPEEVINKLIPSLDMKVKILFNIQLEEKDPENPGKSVLKIWDKGEFNQDSLLRIPIEKEKYEELVSLLYTSQNYNCDRWSGGTSSGKIYKLNIK
jgi:hypothetical protein